MYGSAGKNHTTRFLRGSARQIERYLIFWDKHLTTLNFTWKYYTFSKFQYIRVYLRKLIILIRQISEFEEHRNAHQITQKNGLPAWDVLNFEGNYFLFIRDWCYSPHQWQIKLIFLVMKIQNLQRVGKIVYLQIRILAGIC